MQMRKLWGVAETRAATPPEMTKNKNKMKVRERLFVVDLAKKRKTSESNRLGTSTTSTK